MSSFRRVLRFGLLILAALIFAAAGLSFLSNRGLPTRSKSIDHLDSHEKSYLAEALHLKQALGESLWPAWGRAEIPILAWNEKYGFLVGESNPPSGWERIPDEDILGSPYFRLQNPKREAFAVRIGERWASSIGTKEWMQISFVDDLRNQMPKALRPVFPYRLFLRFFGLNSTDMHIAVVLHESLHAFQAGRSPGRFAEARNAYRDEARYPWDNPEMQRSWKLELGLLAGGLNATSNEETANLAHQFLEHRRERRRQFGLEASMVNYERHMEWLEGLAKYIELALWREASMSHSYTPLPELATDRDFQSYKTFSSQWSKELMTMRMQSSQHGDIRFYYTGMAQAFLLDRIRVGWKDRILDQDVWLEGLLAEATGKR
ncbi:MAG: hypothetical protein ACHQKY_04765 [Terriglobia bacterium]